MRAVIGEKGFGCGFEFFVLSPAFFCFFNIFFDALFVFFYIVPIFFQSVLKWCYFCRKNDFIYWYSIFLLFDKIFNTGRGDKFSILLNSFKISGIKYYFLLSGFTKYFNAWIHKFTSWAPCYLHNYIISLSRQRPI